MIITVVLTYRHAPTSVHTATLDIDAKHAYRDARGRLVTPVHHRQVPARYPTSITEGLRDGIAQLDWMMRNKANPFSVPETGDPEEMAWRLVG